MAQDEDGDSQANFGLVPFTRDYYCRYFCGAAKAWTERYKAPEISGWVREVHLLLEQSSWNVHSAARLDLPIRPERKCERDAKLLFVAGMLNECGKLRLTLLASLVRDECTNAQFDVRVRILAGIGEMLGQLMDVFSDASGK